MRVFYFIVTITLLSMTDCVVDNNGKVKDFNVTSKNFIKEYFHIRDLNPHYVTESSFEYASVDTITIFPFVVEDYENPEPFYERVSEEEFEVCSIKYKDTHFNSSLVYTFEGIVSYTGIKKIDVVTKSVYSREYGENSLLNDVVNITYHNPEDYINNGYKFNISNNEPDYTTSLEDFEITEPLNDFNNKTHDVVGFDLIKLKIAVPPEINGSYSFKIRFESSNGRIFTKVLGPIKISR